MARGDHLYVQCVGYSHHAIDLGDGNVIHFESDPWRKIAGTATGKYTPRVCETTVEEFSQGRPVRVRQYVVSDDPEIVIDRARGRLGETAYDLFGNNCEHFAVWCKTGQHQSTQVDDVVDAVKPLAKGAVLVPLIMRSSRYLPGRLRPLAYGAAVAVTAGSFLHRYIENRYRRTERSES